MRRGKRPRWMIDIAQERMDILFSLAEKEFSVNPLRSHRYVELARNISTKYNTKIPLKWRRRYCKNCHKFLQTGKNSNVRLISSEVHIKCHECNHIMKIPYIKEKKAKRRAKLESYLIQERANE
ncbi:ribonuclease P protein component 4 [Methanobrevibacter filiformis]|uniref:Ribonuclease P protein component 4 n=1 Tax=Methanobrevibacter filiformis TaxID=55758 RepID=A0A166E325_9EURY|nr:ribonuclease P protein component 4 [Methanobrevibacter filiformis]KZX16225.1 ribonuclease P protein component 4 [Methanobrevibacter filiformis]